MCSFIQLLCKNVRHGWNQVLKRCYHESGFLHPLAHLSSSAALSPGRPSLCKWQMAFSHPRLELLSAPRSQGEDREFLSPKVSSTSSGLASVLRRRPSQNQSRRPERWRRPDLMVRSVSPRRRGLSTVGGGGRGFHPGKCWCCYLRLKNDLGRKGGLLPHMHSVYTFSGRRN